MRDFNGPCSRRAVARQTDNQIRNLLLQKKENLQQEVFVSIR